MFILFGTRNRFGCCYSLVFIGKLAEWMFLCLVEWDKCALVAPSLCYKLNAPATMSFYLASILFSSDRPVHKWRSILINSTRNVNNKILKMRKKHTTRDKKTTYDWCVKLYRHLFIYFFFCSYELHIEIYAKQWIE